MPDLVSDEKGVEEIAAGVLVQDEGTPLIVERPPAVEADVTFGNPLHLDVPPGRLGAGELVGLARSLPAATASAWSCAARCRPTSIESIFVALPEENDALRFGHLCALDELPEGDLPLW